MVDRGIIKMYKAHDLQDMDDHSQAYCNSDVLQVWLLIAFTFSMEKQGDYCSHTQSVVSSKYCKFTLADLKSSSSTSDKVGCA